MSFLARNAVWGKTRGNLRRLADRRRAGAWVGCMPDFEALEVRTLLSTLQIVTSPTPTVTGSATETLQQGPVSSVLDLGGIAPLKVASDVGFQFQSLKDLDISGSTTLNGAFKFSVAAGPGDAIGDKVRVYLAFTGRVGWGTEMDLMTGVITQDGWGSISLTTPAGNFSSVPSPLPQGGGATLQLDNTLPLNLPNFLATVGQSFTVTVNLHSTDMNRPGGTPGNHDGALGDLSLGAFIFTNGISVAAQYDDDGVANSFGTYLPFIQLNNQFTVTDVGEHSGTTFQFRFGTATFQPATFVKTVDAASATNQWSFSANMGALSTGADTTLSVRKLDGGSTVTTQTFPVHFKKNLNLNLQVKGPVGSDPSIPVDSVRIIALPSNAPTLSFQATLAGLPLPAQYGPKLDVMFKGATGGAIFGHATYVAAANSLNFKLASNVFDNLNAKANLNWSAALVPQGPTGVVAARLLSVNSQNLLDVPLPDWLSKGAGAYTNNDPFINTNLGTSAGYVFHLSSTQPWKKDLGVSTLAHDALGPLGDLLNLDTTAAAKLDLRVYATLSKSAAKVTADSATLELTLLGNSILPQTEFLKNVHVTGIVDPVQLASPKTVTVKIDPFNRDTSGLALNKRSLGGVQLPTPNPLLHISANASLGGGVDKLSIAETFTIDVSGATPRLDPLNSFVELDAAATASANVEASAEIGIGSLKLVSATAGLDIVAKVQANLRFDIGGTLTDPTTYTLTFDKNKSSATLALDYTLHLNLSLWNGNIELYDNHPQQNPDWKQAQTFVLFGLPPISSLPTVQLATNGTKLAVLPAATKSGGLIGFDAQSKQGAGSSYAAGDGQLPLSVPAIAVPLANQVRANASPALKLESLASASSPLRSGGDSSSIPNPDMDVAWSLLAAELRSLVCS